MRSATKMVVALLLVMMVFILGGCLGATKPDTKQRGTMTIIAKIPDQFRAPAKPTASSVDTRIANLVFTQPFRIRRHGPRAAREEVAGFAGRRCRVHSLEHPAVGLPNALLAFGA